MRYTDLCEAMEQGRQIAIRKDSGKVTVPVCRPRTCRNAELYVAIDGQRRGILRYGDS